MIDGTRSANDRGTHAPAALAFLGACVLFITLVGLGCDATPGRPTLGELDRNTMRGRVLDVITGAPVPDAVVSLGFASTVVRTHDDAPDPTSYRPPPPFLSARSTFDGSYIIRGIPQGEYRITVTHPRFFTQIHSFLFPVRSTANNDFAITPLDFTGDLTGLVLDGATSAPLSNVQVLQLIFGGQAATAADGTFQLPLLPAGINRLLFRAPGYRDLEAVIDIAPTINVSRTFFLVRSGGRIEGTVRSSRDGNPLPRAGVSVLATSITTTADANGRYVLDPVDEGLVSVEFIAPQHDRLVTTTSVIPSRVTTLDVTMRFNRATISGRVTDTVGQGIAGATVAIPAQVLTTTTDLSGNYSFFERVRVENPPQPLAIGASASGFVPSSTALLLSPGQTFLIDFELLSITADLSGLILDAATSLPVANAAVSLPAINESLVTDASGSFLFPDIAGTVYQVDVRSAGYTPTTTFVILPPGVDTNVTIRISP